MGERGELRYPGLLPLMMMAMPRQIAFYAMGAKKANAPAREREASWYRQKVRKVGEGSREGAALGRPRYRLLLLLLLAVIYAIATVTACSNNSKQTCPNIFSLSVYFLIRFLRADDGDDDVLRRLCVYVCECVCIFCLATFVMFRCSLQRAVDVGVNKDSAS